MPVGVPVFCDGFDMYPTLGTNTGIQGRWDLLAGGANASLVAGRFGGQAVRCAAGGVSGPVIFRRQIGTTYTTSGVTYLMAIRVASFASVLDILYLGLSGSVQCGLRVNTDGRLAGYRAAASWVNTNLLQTSTPVCIFLNTWHFIEFSLVCHPTTGTLLVKVDGATVLNFTGNTQALGSAGINEAFFGNTSLQNCDMDDMGFYDTSTSPGQRRVETKLFTADVAGTWTPNAGANNFSRMNEILVDGDTTYIQTGVLNTRMLGTIAPLASVSAQIDGIQITAVAEKTDVTTRAIALTAKSGATDSIGPDFTLSGGYLYYNRMLTVDPATAAAWTYTGANALQIGPKLTV